MNFDVLAAESIRRHREFAARVRTALWVIAFLVWSPIACVALAPN